MSDSVFHRAPAVVAVGHESPVFASIITSIGRSGSTGGFQNGEIFLHAAQAVVLIEQWRRLYNTVRPHSAYGGRPPAPETVKPADWFLGMPQLLGPQTPQGLAQDVVPHRGARHAQVVYTTRDGEEMEAVVGITEEMADEITEHPLQHFGPDIPIVYLEDSPEDARHADNVQIDPLWYRTGQVFFFGSLVGVLVWVTVFLRMRAD